MTLQQIAQVCHEANKSLCEAGGDFSQKPWHECPEWQKEASIQSVEAVIKNPEMTGKQMREDWVQFKLSQGWSYGPVKDAEKKEHPLLCPDDELSEIDAAKDHLFVSIVRGLLPFYKA